MGHQSGQPRREPPVKQLSGPVEGMESTAHAGAGVTDVVQPGGADEHLPVGGRQANPCPLSCGRYALSVCPAVAEAGEERSSELLGLLDRVWLPGGVHPVTVAAG